MKSVVIFGLALLTVSNCDNLDADPPKNPKQKHDSFKLALQWPYSSCKNPKLKCRTTIPKQFTLHGLWPQENGVELTYCTTHKIPPGTFGSMKDDLMAYWPNLTTDNFEKSKSFWEYQWLKHGSCSFENLEPIPYFEKAIALVKANNLLSMLKKKGIEPLGQTYTVKNIVNAVKAVTSHYPNVKCIVEVKDGKSTSYLEEIHLCFDDEAKVIRDCPYRFSKCMESQPGSKVRIAKFSSQDDAIFGSINGTAAAAAP
ncbi:Ribonuclease [Quillaja saponaria]|uniref:Ribonuclease n=1 Tax=Quillaja saponaria TaxID=32244 RepID=A0AAD7Q4P8_QUISA|nr:Ribonuclease [Quillaja saponaria]